MSDVENIKKLRVETGLPLGECKKALEEAGGDMDEAMKILGAKASEFAKKKSERELKAGAIFSYIHSTGTVGVLVEVNCETDFVAKNEEFQRFGKDLAMHIAAMSPESVEDLLDQDFIKDPSVKVKDLLDRIVQKIGERIEITRFQRYQLLE